MENRSLGRTGAGVAASSWPPSSSCPWTRKTPTSC